MDKELPIQLHRTWERKRERLMPCKDGNGASRYKGHEVRERKRIRGGGGGYNYPNELLMVNSAGH